jgi:hypothetical protein
MYGITGKLPSSSPIAPSVLLHPRRRDFMEIVMKNSLVADSSFGSWPAPFCEFPSEPSARRNSSHTSRGEWSPRLRIAVGTTVIAVLMFFVGVTSLLQFGAFERKAGAPGAPRVAEVINASDQTSVRAIPVHPTEGDSK